MEKQLLIRYVEMLYKFESISKLGNSIYPTSEETDLMKKIKELYNSNDEYKNLIKKIHSLPSEERMKAIEDFFAKIDKQEENEKSEEVVISKIFGIDTQKIRHSYLENGKELFSFYDSKLDKEIVLENDKNGKPLVDKLKEIQNNNEKYQTDNAEENTNNILRNQRNNSDIELDMLTKEEINTQMARAANMSGADHKKLQFLLANYERLNIKGINMDNLVYLDEDNIVHEVIVNENNEIAVAVPKEANSADTKYVPQESENIEEENAASFVDSGEEITNSEDIKDNVEGNDIKKDKPKVYTKNNVDGFINNALFVLIAIFVVLVIAIIYIVVKNYVL